MLSKYQVENNSIASSIVNDNVRMVTWAGNKEKILVYPVDYWNQYTITCTHPEHLPVARNRVSYEVGTGGREPCSRS